MYFYDIYLLCSNISPFKLDKSQNFILDISKNVVLSFDKIHFYVNLN